MSLEDEIKRKGFANERFVKQLGWYFHIEDGVETKYEHWLTDRNRLITGCEIKTRGSGWLSGYEYDYIIYSYDLNYLNPENISYNKRYRCTGLFSTDTWAELLINMPVDGVTKDIVLMLSEFSSGCDRELKEHIQKYGKKPSSASGNTTIVNNPSHIAEIRKMHEDGLITKDEMLDLIRRFADKAQELIYGKYYTH